jgi:hypothetical protein
MTRWEYRTIGPQDASGRVSIMDLLNLAGDQGWELVTILSNGIFYLKRPIESTRPTRQSRADPGPRDPAK